MVQQNQQPEQIDDLYNSYDRNLYSIAGDETPLDQMLDMSSGNANANVNNAAAVTADPSTVGSGPTASTTQQTTGSQQSGKTTFDNTVPGYILGFDPKDGN